MSKQSPEDYAWSQLELKAVDSEKRILKGLATTPSTDRQDDIVESMGAEFALPIPFLFQHRSDEPVGHVTKAKVTKSGIEVEIQLQQTDEPGLVKDRLDKAWHDIKLGLVRGLSIGFKPLEVAKIEGGWGQRFIKWLWLELSAVTIAANGDCSITAIKSIDAPVLAATGKEPKASDRPTPPAPGKTKSNPIVRAKEATIMKKTITEQISAFEATRQAKAAELNAIMDAAAETGETLDAEQSEKYDTLKDEVKAVDEHLVRLREAEKMNVAAARPVSGTTSTEASASRGVASVQARDVLPKGIAFVRLLGAKFLAKQHNIPAADVARSKGWGKEIEMVLQQQADLILRAPVAVGNTTDSTWASPLVTYNNMQGEFIELLRARSILARIPGIRRVPFLIKVPRETSGASASWVGEGSPKPVSAMAFDTVTLGQAKVAGIVPITQELMRFSNPAAEGLVQDSLIKGITYLIDRDFLDPSKALVTGVSPASITNGVTAVTASGTTADAFRADLTSLLTAYTASNLSLDTLVVIMTQTQALRLGMMRNDFGNKEFPDINKDGGFIEGVPVITSENIVANGGSPADGSLIVAMNASDILLADDGAVELDISTEASLQMDSSPDSPATASTVLVSLWQNNMVGIRAERFINWIKAKSGSVQYISGGNYR
jgi:HK97 family phage major capsid protein/HK97 family phage prohead protease